MEGTRTSLKQAIDSVLCAMCHVRPPLFEKLLKNLLDNEEDFFISDEFEDQQNDQPPVRNSPNFMHWYKEISRSGHKRLPIIGTQLLTLFAAARSSSGIKQLIDSQLPTVLIKCIIGNLTNFISNCFSVLEFEFLILNHFLYRFLRDGKGQNDVGQCPPKETEHFCYH